MYIGSTLGALADTASGNGNAETVQQVLFWVGLAATIAVTVLVTRLARRALKAAAPAADAQRQEGEVHG